MELWIRSQDKERLTKINNLYVEFNGDVDPTLCPYRIITDKCVDLGIYKSKERALEVLDEIQRKINMIGLGHDFGSPMIDLNNPTYVYEMPKE